MAFVPTIGMIIWMPGRNETTSVVKGIDTPEGQMWLEPFTGGAKYTAMISDRWAEIPPSRVVEAWFLANQAGWPSRAFSTAQAANTAAAADPTAVAILHVAVTGETDIGWVI